MILVKYLLVLIAISILSHAAHSNSAYINEIPDFTQTDVRGENNGNGQQYCAPVAVSNSLMWLSQKQTGQLQLIEKLASSQYMNTRLKNGTGTTGVLNGVNKIAVELFGGYASLEYQGWRKHPGRYSTGVRVPKLDWLARGISKKSAVWLNVGWYRFDHDKNEYRRFGGHWVALVAVENNMLLLHDPAPRAGQSFSNDYVRITEIRDGILVGNKSGLPTSAKGYSRWGGGCTKSLTRISRFLTAQSSSKFDAGSK
jgi:hypothetical protein